MLNDILFEEVCWKAVAANDKEADGSFFYAVRTTGVYCRPSCKSRLPKRENVEYFLSAEHAEMSGYRPCRKCTPQGISQDETAFKIIIRACRLIEKAGPSVTVGEIAEEIGLSLSHFQRLFKRITGCPPKQYISTYFFNRYKVELRNKSSVTEAIYAAGYSSSSRAYEKNSNMLGMTPTEFRQGGKGIEIRYGIAKCHIGWSVVGITERGVCAVMFGNTQTELPHMLQEAFPKADIIKGDNSLLAMVDEVVRSIDYPGSECRLPLDIMGTAFQQRVWHELKNIKSGETAAYGEVAARIGQPKAVRAVANACAANKVGVLVPCHRVVAKHGGVGGYRWGAERKRKLLHLEKYGVPSDEDTP